MKKPFLNLLYDLSSEIGLELYPDDHGACKLLLSNQMKIQIELDPREEILYVICMISPLPPGKFRENVLKHALYGNHFANSTYGILCYIEKLSSLALTESIPLDSITTDSLLDLMLHMSEKGLEWKQALEQNHPAPFVMKIPSQLPSKKLAS